MTCGSKFKQCKLCDLDVYKIYENDQFRESSKGHLCERDCLLFLAECIIDGNGGDDDDFLAALDISLPSLDGSFHGCENASPKTGLTGPGSDL